MHYHAKFVVHWVIIEERAQMEILKRFKEDVWMLQGKWEEQVEESTHQGEQVTQGEEVRIYFSYLLATTMLYFVFCFQFLHMNLFFIISFSFGIYVDSSKWGEFKLVALMQQAKKLEAMLLNQTILHLTPILFKKWYLVLNWWAQRGPPLYFCLPVSPLSSLSILSFSLSSLSLFLSVSFLLSLSQLSLPLGYLWKQPFQGPSTINNNNNNNPPPPFSLL